MGKKKGKNGGQAASPAKKAAQPKAETLAAKEAKQEKKATKETKEEKKTANETKEEKKAPKKDQKNEVARAAAILDSSPLPEIAPTKKDTKEKKEKNATSDFTRAACTNLQKHGFFPPSSKTAPAEKKGEAKKAPAPSAPADASPLSSFVRAACTNLQNYGFFPPKAGGSQAGAKGSASVGGGGKGGLRPEQAERVRSLLAVVPKEHDQLRKSLALALKSDRCLLCDEAVDALCAMFGDSKAAAKKQKAGYTAESVLAVVPASEAGVRSALELQIKSGVQLVANEALTALGLAYGAKKSVAPSEEKGKKGKSSTSVVQKAAKADPINDFWSNSQKNQARDSKKREIPTSVIQGGAPAGPPDSAASVGPKVQQLRAENMALKRAVTMARANGQTCVSGSLTSKPVCPCLRTPATIESLNGLPDGYSAWTKEQVKEFALGAGVKESLCDILVKQDVNGACLPELTFKQLKSDGFTTGMALKLIRAIEGR